MKVRNIIRASAIAIGFAAALFAASSTPAQEIENTEWADGPNVVTPSQAVAPVATASSATVAEVQANAGAMPSKPVVAQEAAASQRAPIEGGWLTTFFVVCFAGATFYALAGTRRSNRLFDVRSEHTLRSIPLI